MVKKIIRGVFIALLFVGAGLGTNIVLDRFVVEPSWGSWNHNLPQRREVVEWQSYKRGWWWSIHGRCRVSLVYMGGELTELYALDFEYGSDSKECEDHFKNNPPPTLNPQAFSHRKHGA